MNYYHPYYNGRNYPQYSPYADRREGLEKTLKVQGNGTISVLPDICEINIGVVTEDKDLEKAQRENAKKTNMIIEKLSEIGIEEDDIETISYRVEPLYDYVDGRQVFKGYRVSNILLLTIEDLDEVGYIIDVSVKAGANIVRNIEFKVSDPSKYYQEALNLAVLDAIKKAQGVGNTLGVLVEKIPYEVVEESYSYGPVIEPIRYGSPQDTTPIMVGKIDITSKVRATFKY